MRRRAVEHEVAAVVPVHFVERGAHLLFHSFHAGAHALQLVLHEEDALDAREIQPELGRQPLDQPQPLDIRVRVETRVAGSALRRDETTLVVDAKRLRMHADELRGDRDHVARPVVDHRVFSSSSSSSRCFFETRFGTWMRMRASTSPWPEPLRRGAPRPLMRSSLPSSVPLGTFNDTGPSGVGTSTLPPSAAVEYDTGTLTTRSSPRRS